MRLFYFKSPLIVKPSIFACRTSSRFPELRWTLGKVDLIFLNWDYVYTGPDEFGTVHHFVRFGLAFTRNPRNRTNSSTVSRTN